MDNGTYLHGIEILKYINRRDEIDLKWLTLSLFGRHDGIPHGLHGSVIATTGIRIRTLYYSIH